MNNNKKLYTTFVNLIFYKGPLSNSKTTSLGTLLKFMVKHSMLVPYNLLIKYTYNMSISELNRNKILSIKVKLNNARGTFNAGKELGDSIDHFINVTLMDVQSLFEQRKVTNSQHSRYVKLVNLFSKYVNEAHKNAHTQVKYINKYSSDSQDLLSTLRKYIDQAESYINKVRKIRSSVNNDKRKIDIDLRAVNKNKNSINDTKDMVDRESKDVIYHKDKATRSMYKTVVMILGMFSAIVLAAFGGLQLLGNIFGSVSKLKSQYVGNAIVMGAVYLFGVYLLLILLLAGIFKIVKNTSNKDIYNFIYRFEYINFYVIYCFVAIAVIGLLYSHESWWWIFIFIILVPFIIHSKIKKHLDKIKN